MATAHFPPYGDGGRLLSDWFSGPEGERTFRQHLIRAYHSALHEDRDFINSLEKAYYKRGMSHVLPQAGYDRLMQLAFVYFHQDSPDDPPHSA